MGSYEKHFFGWGMGDGGWGMGDGGGGVIG